LRQRVHVLGYVVCVGTMKLRVWVVRRSLHRLRYFYLVLAVRKLLIVTVY
jgi:hypothetical protein